MSQLNMTKIPILPLSALIFYLLLIVLWKFNLIPSPKELLEILENFYQHYGLLGLIVATFLEGTAYIGLYVPGAFIIALTVFLSNKSFISLITISLIVSITLTLTSFVNYYFGKHLASKSFRNKKDIVKESEMLSRGFVVSMLHPNLLAFYFFNAGLEKRNFNQILYVPFFMFPYGLFVAYLLSVFSNPIRHGLESPTLMLTIIIIWFVAAFLKENKKRIIQNLDRKRI